MNLSTVLSLFTKFATIGGGLWLVWGVIIVGTALKDKNGPDIKSGTWQVVGGAMIIAAAQYFGSITV